MCILGGTRSLTGALVGTGTYLLLEEWLAGLTEHWKMLFGPLLVAVVIFAPGGLIAIGSWFKSGRSRG
jgi:branched-chain amino acid transport system permease protein